MEISNLGEAKFFLGIEIVRNRQDKKIILLQRQFIEQKMQKFNKFALKPTEDPLQRGV
jgi:hypothetical protein